MHLFSILETIWYVWSRWNRYCRHYIWLRYK